MSACLGGVNWWFWSRDAFPKKLLCMFGFFSSHWRIFHSFEELYRVSIVLLLKNSENNWLFPNSHSIFFPICLMRWLKLNFLHDIYISFYLPFSEKEILSSSILSICSYIYAVCIGGLICSYLCYRYTYWWTSSCYNVTGFVVRTNWLTGQVAIVTIATPNTTWIHNKVIVQTFWQWI